MFIDCRFAARSVETKTIVTVIQHMPRSAIVVLLWSHDTVSLDCMWEGYSTLHVWLLILLAPWFFFSFFIFTSWDLVGNYHVALFSSYLSFQSFYLFIEQCSFLFSFSILLLLGRRIWELSSAVLFHISIFNPFTSWS